MKSKSLVAFEVYPCCSGKDVILSDSILSFFFEIEEMELYFEKYKEENMREYFYDISSFFHGNGKIR